MKNISELFKTAKSEIIRKDRRIADLQRELDDLMFRRGFGGQKRMRSEERKKEDGAQLWKNQSGSRRSPSMVRMKDNDARSSKEGERNFNRPHHWKNVQDRGRRGNRNNSFMARRRYVENDGELSRNYNRPHHWKNAQDQRENRNSPTMTSVRDEHNFEECDTKRNREEFTDRSQHWRHSHFARIKQEQRCEETETKGNEEESSNKNNYKNAENHKRSRRDSVVSKDHERERQKQSADTTQNHVDRQVINENRREYRSRSRDCRYGKRYRSVSREGSGNKDNKKNYDGRVEKRASSETTQFKKDNVNYKESLESKSENLHKIPKSPREIEYIEQTLEEGQIESDINLDQKSGKSETVTSQINIDTEIQEVECKTECASDYTKNNEDADTSSEPNNVPSVNEIDKNLRTSISGSSDANATKKLTPPAKRRRCVVSFKN